MNEVLDVTEARSEQETVYEDVLRHLADTEANPSEHHTPPLPRRGKTGLAAEEAMAAATAANPTAYDRFCTAVEEEKTAREAKGEDVSKQLGPELTSAEVARGVTSRPMTAGMRAAMPSSVMIREFLGKARGAVKKADVKLSAVMSALTYPVATILPS